MSMNQVHKDPLHGITLQQIMTWLVEQYGWEYLAGQIRINCFHHDPSIKSCLTFLRKTPWARTKVENLYIYLQRKHHRKTGGESAT